MLNLAMLLESSAAANPAGPAVIFNDTKLNYAQVNGAANQLANGLRQLGVQRGDKVALSCLNIPYFPIAYYAILKLGATVVPFNVLFKGREIAYHLKDSDAVALIVFQGTPELPMAQMALEGFQQAPDCRHLIVATADPAAASPIEGEGVTTLGRVMAGQSPMLRHGADHARRDGSDPLHLRHHGQSQGRGTDPQQHGHERGSDARHDRHEQRRRLSGSAAAVPLLWPDRAHEHRLLRRARPSRCCRALQRMQCWASCSATASRSLPACRRCIGAC